MWALCRPRSGSSWAALCLKHLLSTMLLAAMLKFDVHSLPFPHKAAQHLDLWWIKGTPRRG